MATAASINAFLVSPRGRQAAIVLLSTTILLRSRFFPTLSAVARASDAEIQAAQQELYEVDEQRSDEKVLLVPWRRRISRVKIRPTLEGVLAAHRHHFPLPPSSPPSLNGAFLKQLRALLLIILPHYVSKEGGMVLLHSFFLVLRTMLSVMVARLDGRIVRDLVSADGPGFARGIGLWFLLAIPSTYTNAMLRYLQSKLALAFRTRLTRYTHDLYLSPALEYYRLIDSNALNGGADQYITTDIQRFCDSLSSLYGNVLKPTLDMLIFTTQLSRSLGGLGTLGLFGNYFFAAYILRRVTPAFGKLAAVEARLEGEYRTGVGRIGRDSEEIAFYGGGLREKSILWRAYLRLISHVNSIYKIRIAYEWTEDYVIKYLWSAAGYCLMSIPVFIAPSMRSVGVQAPSPEGERPWDQVAGRTESYISNRRLLLSLADAGGRLMYSYKDLAELAGYTSRVYTLISTLYSLHASPPGRHVIITPDRIALNEVNVCAPGMLLVRDLNLVVERGQHVLISGPNGVGKTAVARVIAGLWEADEGEVERPAGRETAVFIVPQKAYLAAGTLLDQVIYPHAYPQFKASGRTEEDLREILRAVHLEYVLDREGGWQAIKEWRDVLSGGEKQRMGMARLFYHRPTFAILDECTSAVSSDVEGLMYQHAKDLGITLITISTRPALTKYHSRLLKLVGDGRGSWEVTKVGTEEERMERDREIIDLEERLNEEPRWKARLNEIDAELGVKRRV